MRRLGLLVLTVTLLIWTGYIQGDWLLDLLLLGRLPLVGLDLGFWVTLVIGATSLYLLWLQARNTLNQAVIEWRLKQARLAMLQPEPDTAAEAPAYATSSVLSNGTID